MIGAAASYIAGLFFASFFMGAIPFLIIAAFAATIGILNKFSKHDYILISVSFVLAVTVSTCYTHFRYDNVTSYSGKTADFSGEVIEHREYSADKASYVLKGELGGMKNVRVVVYCDDLNVRYGDIITFNNCVFSGIDGDYLTDSMDYFRSERVFLSIESFQNADIEHTGTRKLRNAIIDYRERIVSEFRMTLGEDAGAFLSGLVFGRKQGMDNEILTSFHRCGIGHVLAVSGLHVSIIAIALMSLLRLLKVNRFIAFGLMDALLIMLILMADSPVSAIRAAIMMNFAYSAHLFRRRTDALNSLSAALLLICLVNPYAVYSSGLILSAAGTFGISVYAPYLTGKFPTKGLHWRFARAFCTMLCTTVCIMPFTMKFFDETSLISPLVNVFIVPLCSVAMVIGVLYVITGGLISLLGIAGALVEIILDVSHNISQVWAFYFSSRSEKAAEYAIALIAVVALVRIIFVKRRYTAAATAAACAMVFISSAVSGFRFNNQFTVAVLGRRHNAAVVVSYHGKTQIIDLSGHYKSAEYVKKYLAENGINTAEFLVLTKNNQSQYAAYAKKLESVDVGNIVTVGDTPVIGGDSEAVPHDSDWELYDDKFAMNYSSGVLTVNYGEAHTAIIPVKSEFTDEYEDGLNVFFGTGIENESNTDDTVYKSSINGTDNFEITLKESGRYRIRRL